MRPLKLTLTLATLCLAAGVAIAQPQPQPQALPVPAEEAVLGYLEQLVQWQRTAAAIEPSAGSAREVVFEAQLQQDALKVVRNGFNFARQEAKVGQATNEDATQTDDQLSPHQRMLQRAADADKQVADLNKQIASKALSPERRQVLEGDLKIALARQELFQTVLANMNTVSSGSSNDLKGKIANLAREIPELDAEGQKPAAKAAEASAAPTAVTARPVTSILSLAGDMFDVARKQRELKDFISQTTQLENGSHDLLKELRSSLDAITGDSAQQSVDAQVTNFKQLGSLIVPLGQATMWITASKDTVADWQQTLDTRFAALLRQLAIHLALLAFTLAIPVLIGEAARRAIARYITDAKRTRQANTARRILVGITVVLILLFNFISDFSSFATFAGFMTAGLAVALQSVLLSLVGHFFFYGRYGVRPGDRVKVGDVVGDIVLIGMLRFYLRELKESAEGEMQPTGKIVAFPNSILFQPVAFYKYLPELP